MTITTNIEAVQERIRLLQSELPKVLLRALDPVYWVEVLKFSATKVLRAQWNKAPNLAHREAYEKLTPLIVATVMGALYDSGAWFTMTVPHASLDLSAVWPEAARASFYNQTISPTGQVGRPTKLATLVREGGVDPAVLFQEDQQNLERVKQTILDWVTTEKHWDPRDYHADGSPGSPQERAERIYEIMGLTPKLVTDVMHAARLELAQAVQDWLAGKGDTQPSAATAKRAAVPSEQVAPPPAAYPEGLELAAEVGLWLELVLAAWVVVVRERLPMRIEREMRKLRVVLKK